MPLYNYSLLPLDALCVHHRLNPGVCWYWLNNNCLNPKCAYWHPPLDGLLGAQIPISTGPSAPVAAHVSNASTKKGMPCMYFQKGCCLKGDWCPFLHAPNSSSTKALPMPETTFSDELATIKKRLAELEKSVQQQKVTSINAAKSFKDTTGAKLPVLLESAPPRNEFVLKRRAPLQSGITEFSGQRSAPQQSGITEFLGHGNAPHLSNGNQVSWSCRAQQPQLSEDSESLTRNNAEEVSREPSPGFDVLVDDEGKGSDFYAGEDRYRMSRKRDAEYDTDHPINDFNIINGVGDEGYHDRFFFPSLEHRMGQYALEQHRASFGGSYQESRPYSNLHNLGQVDESDLRYTLAKHKKPNGLRSVISHENASYMLGDWNYQGLRWDGQHITSGENYFGSYFQLPQRSLSLNNRDMVRGTDRRDMVRTNIPSDRGRSYNSIQVEVEDDYNNGGKKCRGQQSLGKRKHLMLDGQLQQGGNDVPFEGPKPLEEILKRKRRETVGTVVDRNSSNNDVTVVEKNQEGATNNMTSTPVGNNEEAHKNTTTIHDTEMDKSKIKDGMLREDGVDQESEPSEQRDGESYYDHIRVERTMNCKMENEHAKGEYIDEEEEDNDDEFTKKMGL